MKQTKVLPYLLLALVLALVAACNVWFVFNSAEPAAYGHEPLNRALTNVERWETSGWRAFPYYLRADGIIVDFQLTQLLGAFLLKIDARDWHWLMLAPLLWLLVLLAAIYFIARRLADDWAGILAVAVALGMPGIFGWSHFYSSLTGNMALAALAVWLCLAAERGKRWGLSALAGVLTALCLKGGETVGEAFTTVLTVLPVAIILFASAFNKDHRRNLVGLLFFLLSFAAFFDWPWIVRMAAYFTREASGSPIPFTLAIDTSWRSHFAYAESLFLLQAWPLAAFLFLFALPRLAWRDIRLRAMTAWLFVPLIGLSLLSKKNVFYLQPALPALPILVGVGLRSIRIKSLAFVLQSVAFASCSFFFVATLSPRPLLAEWQQSAKALVAAYFQLQIPDLLQSPVRRSSYAAVLREAKRCQPDRILLLTPSAAPADRMLGAHEQTLKFLFYLQPESPPLHDLFFSLPAEANAQRSHAEVTALLTPPPQAWLLLGEFAEAKSAEEFHRFLSESFAQSIRTRQRHREDINNRQLAAGLADAVLAAAPVQQLLAPGKSPAASIRLVCLTDATHATIGLEPTP